MNRFRIVERVVADELAKPYDYGTADCFMLGCRVADALGDRALSARYGDTYKTLLGAQRALRKRGHKSLVGLFALHLEQCPPAQARLGDLAILLLPDGGEHVAVHVGQSGFLTKTERGQSLHPASRAIAAFRT